jgi:hypothetical protein
MKTCKYLYDVDDMKHLRNIPYNEALQWKIDRLTKRIYFLSHQPLNERDTWLLSSLLKTLNKTKHQLLECS